MRAYVDECGRERVSVCVKKENEGIPNALMCVGRAGAYKLNI